MSLIDKDIIGYRKAHQSTKDEYGVTHSRSFHSELDQEFCGIIFSETNISIPLEILHEAHIMRTRTDSVYFILLKIFKNVGFGLLALFIIVTPQRGLSQSAEELLRQGTTLFNQEKPEQAEEVFRKIVTLYPEYEEGYVRLGAVLFLQRGRVKESNEIYEKLFKINPNNRAAYFHNLSQERSRQISQGNFTPGKLGLQVSQIAPDVDKTLSLFKLGIDEQQKGNNSQAMKYYEESLLAANYSRISIPSFNNLVNLYLKHKKYQSLLKITERQVSSNASEPGAYYGSIPLSRVYYGIALSQFSRYSEAESAFYEGIGGASTTFNFLGKEDDASNPLFENIPLAYKLWQRSLVEQDKTEQALEIAEQSRVRLLVDVLIRRFFRDDFLISKSPYSQISVGGSGEQAEVTMTLPTLTINEIRSIVKNQNSTVVNYSIIPPSQDHPSEIYIWVIKPTGKIHFQKQVLPPFMSESINTFIANTRKEIISTRSDGTKLSLQDLKVGDLIRTTDHESEQGLLPYQIQSIDLKTKTIIVKNSPINGVPIPFSNVRSKVQSLNGVYSHLQSLYKILIAPIQDQLPTSPEETVIFIPQDELSSVPFAALQDENGKFLIEKHTISTIPALQVLDLTNKRKLQIQGKASQILIVGNPAMPTLPGSVGPLSKLPQAEKEAISIGQLWDTQPLIGKNATKAAVLGRISSARIIHFATHGILSDQNGIKNSLVLTPSQNDNGLLTAEEIFRFNLVKPRKNDVEFANNTELAILSACNTGQGTSSTDEVIGLARSIISAGIPSVVISLWSVPDAPTADLMVEFHRQIRQNPNKAQALRQAMLQIIKTKPNPVDWAAFTLVGQP